MEWTGYAAGMQMHTEGSLPERAGPRTSRVTGTRVRRVEFVLVLLIQVAPAPGGRDAQAQPLVEVERSCWRRGVWKERPPQRRMAARSAATGKATPASWRDRIRAPGGMRYPPQPAPLPLPSADLPAAWAVQAPPAFEFAPDTTGAPDGASYTSCGK